MTDDLELDLDLGELKTVLNAKWQTVPIVYFSKCGKFMMFNRRAERELNGNPLQISFNTDYVVFTPTTGGFGYRVTPTTKGSTHVSAVALTRQIPQLKGKHYKLYKSGNRYAIKRYEPLEDV